MGKFDAIAQSSLAERELTSASIQTSDAAISFRTFGQKLQIAVTDTFVSRSQAVAEGLDFPTASCVESEQIWLP